MVGPIFEQFAKESYDYSNKNFLNDYNFNRMDASKNMLKDFNYEYTPVFLIFT